ncbi:hypothetical protein ONZ45_g12255 [Pleurotus djamor]|nr:hypothetical protein ONZ45_g12255 [Pleurotus djamor]
MNTVSASTDTYPSAISRLPQEILFQVFSFLTHEEDYDDNLHACQICRLWLPGAQAALYHSIVLSKLNIHTFARTIESSRSLVRLVRRLIFHRTDKSSMGTSMDKIIDAVSQSNTLFSLHLHADTLLSPVYHGRIKKFPSLRSLSIDTNIFPSFHAIKVFITSLPHLRVLKVNDEVGWDFSEGWYDESGFDFKTESLGFPTTLEEVTSNLPGSRTVDAFLTWIASCPDASLSVRRFSFMVTGRLNDLSLTPSLKAFGSDLKSLTLDYQWPSDLPIVNLRANESLRSLTLQLDLFNEGEGYIKLHISRVLGTLPPSSLQTINLAIRLNSRSARFSHILDVELLDNLTGSADIYIFRTNEASKGIDISEDLHTVSHNDTLFSLQLHANTLIDPRYHTETIRSLPSLRHLSLDTNIFPSLYAMKSFIASFPQLQGLEVNDEFGGDFSDEWYDESALDTPVELPITLRNLGYHLPGYDTLDALLRWIPRQAESSASVQRFSLTINRANDGAAVTPLLRAFGTGLEYLSLDYRWPSYIPTIDLNANTNLRSLALQMELFDEYADLMKTHLSHMFDTLSSSSLKVIDITIKLNSPSVSLDQVIDLEALEKSTMTTGINIFVSLPGRNVEETMEVEDWVEGQMPRHVSQSRLQCTVSRAWDTE